MSESLDEFSLTVLVYNQKAALVDAAREIAELKEDLRVALANNRRIGEFISGEVHDIHAKLEAERDAALTRVKQLEGALGQSLLALDHAIHRPHEHNPMPGFTRVGCEILLEAAETARAALSPTAELLNSVDASSKPVVATLNQEPEGT